MLRTAVRVRMRRSYPRRKEIELFEREIEVLKSIDHPLIPNYIDHFQEEQKEGKLFVLVQEYVGGENLYHLVKHGRRFSSDEVKQLLMSLLDTVRYIHTLHPPIVHRDITPKNIVLDEKDNVYLVDFGAVGHIAEDGKTFVGTMGYMPPEQMYGRSTPASDLYSIGVTMLFLLSGKDPGNLVLVDMKLDYDGMVEVPEDLKMLLDRLIEPSLKKRLKTSRQALRILKEG